MFSIFGLFEEGLHDIFGGGNTNPSPFKMNGFEIGGAAKPDKVSPSVASNHKNLRSNII